MLFHVRVLEVCASVEILGLFSGKCLWLHAHSDLCVCVCAFVCLSVCVNQREHNGIRQRAFGQAGERELFNPE